VAAELLGLPVGEAEELVDELVDAQMLDVTVAEATGGPRYRFHDLIHLYARERASSASRPR
jgi:hypothetical protein